MPACLVRLVWRSRSLFSKAVEPRGLGRAAANRES